jgi:Uma2 family endonuclease
MSTAVPLPYERPDEPEIDHLVTEDDTPVDNLPSERQARLLVDSLYAGGWQGPPPDEDGQPRLFLAAANVGLFATNNETGIVPDVFVSLDVTPRPPIWEKKNRSYFFWVFGKPPELVLEIVSNREGGELDVKRRRYARMRIDYYVVYDPAQHLGGPTLQAFERRGQRYEPIDPWFSALGLGLVEQQSEYEGVNVRWLRWRTKDGAILPTGSERAEAETKRAEAETKRAEAETKRAEAETKRADTAEARAERLRERLRAAGIDPDADP